MLISERTSGMTSGSTRRQFLGTTGVAVGMAGRGSGAALSPARNRQSRQRLSRLLTRGQRLRRWPRCITTCRTPITSSAGSSTASRSTTGGPSALHRPPFEIASLFIEQVSAETDLGRPKAERHGVRLSPDDRRRPDPGNRQARRRRRPPDRRARRVPLQREAPEAVSAGSVLPRSARGFPRLGPRRAGVHRQALIV